MTEAFYAVLKASFQGSIVILAVILLRQLLKKAPKSLFCLLWLLAGLRLALPFEIESPLSLQPRMDAPELTIQAETPVRIPSVMVPDQNMEAAPEQVPSQPEGNREDAQSDSYLYHVEDGVITGPVTIGDVASQLWVLGAALMLAASAVSYWKLKHRVREAYLIENGCFECPGLETAFVLGFLPPKIYLPMGLTDQEKKFIFDHENTHIARHDHWYKLLGYLVLSLHWFNPMVWIGYGLLCRDMELACDEHVIKYMSLAERKAYSAALLSCGSHTARVAACPVAFGESNPKKRILNVLNYKRPTFWISLLAIIAVAFVAVCLMTSPAKKEESTGGDELFWNLEMNVNDVTPSGLTVEFIQHGPFQGYDRAELQFGSDYSLEKWVDGNWAPVEMLPQEYEVAWTMEAYVINRSSTTTQRIDWEWLYGRLPAGRYRIGKGVDLFRMAGDYDSELFWAEFEIAATDPEQPVWNMEMTDEEYLELCRNAVAELQDRDTYHISETLVYYVNDREDARSHVAYWGDGANAVRQSYVTRIKQTRTHLYYGGHLYYRVQEDSDEPAWSLVETDHGAQYNLTWLHLLNWDDQIVTFEYAEQVEDILHVFVTVHSTPTTLGWDDVNAYTVGFFFDQSGNLDSAILGCIREEINVVSELKIEDTADTNIRSQVKQFADQRPADLMQDTSENAVQRCREAMMTLKNSEELYLYIESLDDPMETTNVYMHASNGWLFKYRRPGWDCEEVQWFRLGNAQYIYGGDMDDNGIMTTPYYWQVEQNPQSHDYQLPYPFDLDWENIELTYDGTVTGNGTEAVTILFPLYLDKYTFYFVEEELLYFDVGDSTGEPEATTSRIYVRFPYDGTVADYLAGLYEEVSAKAGQKPGTPDEAFYEELFTRKTDGHYTEEWIYDLFKAFYACPEEFVRHLAGSGRAEEVITHMGYYVELYAPYRFASVLTKLGEDPNTDPAVLALLEAIG